MLKVLAVEVGVSRVQFEFMRDHPYRLPYISKTDQRFNKLSRSDAGFGE